MEFEEAGGGFGPGVRADHSGGDGLDGAGPPHQPVSGDGEPRIDPQYEHVYGG